MKHKLRRKLRAFVHRYVILVVIGAIMAALVAFALGEPLAASRFIEVALGSIGDAAVDVIEDS